MFTEPEGESFDLTASISPTLNPSLYSFVNSTNTFSIFGLNNSHVGAYTITITATDNHGDTTPGSTSFVITVTNHTGCTAYSNRFQNYTYVAHSNTSISISNIGNGVLFDAPSFDTMYRYRLCFFIVS